MIPIKRIFSPSYFIVIAGTIISCLAAFYNQFPFVYPDTGTYIRSGFEAFYPGDRPIFYGLFLRHTSLYYSLWLVIFAQGLISSYLIYKTLGLFCSKKSLNSYFLISIITLVFFTGYSFNVTILIPDIFTSLSILCVINLLFNKELKNYEKVILYALFIFSVITHFSNILIILLLTLIVFVINYRKSKKDKYIISWKKINSIGISLIFSIFLIIFSNYYGGKGFVISNSSHVFIFNHLREIGLVKSFLEENCNPANKYKFCDYINDQTPDFIWNPDSPLYKTGGWENNRHEYNEIITKIVTDPKNWEILSLKTVQYTFQQFFTFDTEIHTQENKPGGPVYGQMEWRFPRSMKAYLSSKQNTGQHNIKPLNIIHFAIGICSFGVLFLFSLGFLKKAKELEVLRFIILIILLHNLLNCLITSNLSLVIDRYQNRLIWLFPLFALIIFKHYIQTKKAK